MPIYLTSPNLLNVADANAQIEVNCNIPCPGTERWDIPTESYDKTFWFILMPPENGWNQYSQEQMMAGVVNVEIQEGNPSWFPPVIPPEN